MTVWDMEACECCTDRGLCCYTMWCPCIAFKEAANNMGSGKGWLYCLATFPCGLGCCALTLLGKEAAEKRGIELSMCKSAWRSFCFPCYGYSCTVVNESRLIKSKSAGVYGQKMQR